MITVCIPTYNGEKYIREQLDSILLQLSDEDEVIISDDSSTDLTVRIIESIDDGRIRLLKANAFHNPIYNMENALKNAKGDYIFMADQDDVWLPNKVSIMQTVLKDYTCVVSDCIIVDSEKKVLRETMLNGDCSVYPLKNILWNRYMGCTMAFRRELLDYALPFPKHIDMHDSWLGNVSNIFFSTKLIPDKLILYRRHGTNVSQTSEKSNRSFINRLLGRFYMFYYIIRLYLVKK